MNVGEVKRLVQRIGRVREITLERHGGGFQWDYTFGDGQTHTYAITGLKSPEVIGDDVANWCVWVWSLKDRLKDLAASAGRGGQVVEDVVNQDRNLQLCADLANREKHGTLKQSRSGFFPKLGDVTYTLPQQGVAALTIGAFAVTVDTKDPNLLELALPIEDGHGNQVGDAFAVLDAAMRRWEALLNEWGHAV